MHVYIADYSDLAAADLMCSFKIWVLVQYKHMDIQ